MNLMCHANCGGQILVVGERGCRYFRFACSECGERWNVSQLPDAFSYYPDIAETWEPSGDTFESAQRAAEHAVRNEYAVRNRTTGAEYAVVAYGNKHALSQLIRLRYPRGHRTEQYASGNWCVFLTGHDVGGDCGVRR